MYVYTFNIIIIHNICLPYTYQSIIVIKCLNIVHCRLIYDYIIITTLQVFTTSSLPSPKTGAARDQTLLLLQVWFEVFGRAQQTRWIQVVSACSSSLLYVYIYICIYIYFVYICIYIYIYLYIYIYVYYIYNIYIYILQVFLFGAHKFRVC